MSKYEFNLPNGKEEKVKSDIFNPEDYAQDLSFDDVPTEIISKIDESDLPIPANFMEACIGKKFLNTTVLPRQIQIASQFFGEICPHCSNKEAIDNLYDQKISWILDNIMFLRHGKCPKCGRTKLDLMNENYYTYPDALYVIAGQRCVTKDTIVYTKSGLRRIGSYSKNKIGFTSCEDLVYNGKEFVKTKMFFEGYPEVVKHIVGEYGSEIGGTNDHPIMVFQNFCLKFNKLYNVNEGKYFLIKYGQNIWSKEEPKFDDFNSIYEARFGVDYEKEISIPKTANKYFCEWLGWFVSNGYNIDEDVLVGFSKMNESLKKHFIKLTKKVFPNVKLLLDIKSNLVIKSKKVISFLQYITSSDYLPNCVLSNTKENVSSFLRSYFELRSTIKKDILCECNSYGTANRFRILLLNFGIFSLRVLNTLKIANKDLSLFNKTIGFISNKKIDALTNAIKNSNCVSSNLKALNDSFVCVYKEVLNLLNKENRKSIEKEFGDIVKRLGKDISLRRNVLVEFLDKVNSFDKSKISDDLKTKLELLSKFRDENLLLEKVVSTYNTFEATYDFNIPKSHRFLSNGFISHNSGKSILSGGLIPRYHDMRMITMTNKKGKRVTPYIYFHNPPSPLYGTFTAASLGQAIKNLWEPFKGYNDSPWYKLYFEILDYYGKKFGIELYKKTTTILQYNHKKLGWLCEVPDKTKLRGKTRHFFGCDEVSWFDSVTKDDSVKGSAKEVMAAGRNSLLTVRRKALGKLEKGNYNIPTGIECYVSSPAENNDILMRKVREAKHNSTMLSFRYATWEFNPDYKTPEDIGEPDQMILMRDFGACPPLGNSQYYSDSKNLIEMIGVRKAMANFSVVENKNTFGDTNLYPKVDNVLYTSTYPKILTLDNGLSGNCFSASICHIANKKIVNDALVCVRPTKEKRINLSKCFDEFVMGLVNNKAFNIIMVAYDRWNSAQAIDSLKDSNIKALQYSITYKDFSQIKESFGTKSFIFAKPNSDCKCLINYDGDFDFNEMGYQDPYFGLLYQILTVRDLGKILTKPVDGDDDVFRAWALGVSLLMNEKYNVDFKKEGAVNTRSGALGCLAMSRGSVPASSPSSGLESKIIHKLH